MSGKYGVKIISDAQIAGAAKAAGFTGDDVTMATAIALAESGGDMYAYNPVAPDLSFGLMQINMIGDMGPSRRRAFGLSRNEDLFNPTTNMRVARSLRLSRKNWHDWSTYSDGSYKTYWNRARLAAGSPNSSIPTGDVGTATQVGLTDGIDQFSKAADFLTAWQTWARAGMIIGGGILVIVALSIVSGTTAKVAKAADMATDLIPQTRGVKAAAKAIKGAK